MSKFLTRLALVYVWALVAVRLIYMLIGDWMWPIIIPMMFFAVLLVPVAIAWAIALRSRSRFLLIGCTLLTLLAVQMYFPRFNRANAETGAATFTVVSFNVLGVNPDPENVARIVAEADADIVGLQEVDSVMANTLETVLAEQYPYQWHDPQGIPGMGILSKHPFERQPFESNSIWVGQTQPVILDTPHGEIAWVNQHYIVTAPFTRDPVEFTNIINWTFDERTVNAQETLNWQSAVVGERPMLVTMDFNGTDFSDAYEVITSGNLADTWLEVGRGFGFTFPPFGTHPLAVLPFPYLRLDYILHTPELQPLTIETLEFDGNSDHLGLIAVFEISQE